MHPIVGSNDPKPEPIYASLRLAFHPKCLIRTEVHCTVPIKISNYPLSIFFLDPPLKRDCVSKSTMINLQAQGYKIIGSPKYITKYVE